MSESDPERPRAIGAFLAGLGFRVAAPDLVSQALVHRSYAAEQGEIPDNERLEFLGDAVLGSLAAQFLFERFPGDAEGELSKKKAFAVSRSELGKRAGELGLAPLILLGRGEESSGGRDRSSILGSALEALIGALSLQMALADLEPFVRKSILEPALPALADEAHVDDKSRLQEVVQSRGWPVPDYRKVNESGPAHEKSFTVDVYVCGACPGHGVRSPYQGGREPCRLRGAG